MGGLAFVNDEFVLTVPRLSPSQYEYMRKLCHERLSKAFAVVASPIEGPAKKTYGDVDIFVAWNMEHENVMPSGPLSASGPSRGYARSLMEGAIAELGGVHSKQDQSDIAAVAVPWPDELFDSSTPRDPENDYYVQVDVHICESLKKLQWMLFKNAHGDLWNILGSIIRPFGLTIDENAMFLRIPEIESLNKKKAKVLVTDNPIEILRFLGLKFDGAQWEEPFGNMEDLFEYAATCRLFWVRSERARASDASDAEPGVDAETDKSKLKANDRRRMRMRNVFRAWVEEFVPKCRAEGRFSEQQTTRDDVREQAFQDFPLIKAAWATQLRDWKLERQRDLLRRDAVKALLPQDLSGHYLNVTAAAFKKIVLDGNERYGILAPASLRDADGVFDKEKLQDWIRTAWEDVGAAAWKLDRTQNRERLAKRGVKRTAAGSEKTDDQSADGAKADDTKAEDIKADDTNAEEDQAVGDAIEKADGGAQ